MKVKELVDIINRVCGLSENWAKVCVYYCMATHKLKIILWMLVLDFVAPYGSGKTEVLKVLRQICYDALVITCHGTMSSVILRGELQEAKNRTWIIEEADLYPNSRELERYLINRVDRRGTSVFSVYIQEAGKGGAINWRKKKIHVYGATIVHDRHGFSDLATQRRSIVINIEHNPNKVFLKPYFAQLEELASNITSVRDLTTVSVVESAHLLVELLDPLIALGQMAQQLSSALGDNVHHPVKTLDVVGQLGDIRSWCPSDREC